MIIDLRGHFFAPGLEAETYVGNGHVVGDLNVHPAHHCPARFGISRNG